MAWTCADACQPASSPSIVRTWSGGAENSSARRAVQKLQAGLEPAASMGRKHSRLQSKLLVASKVAARRTVLLKVERFLIALAFTHISGDRPASYSPHDHAARRTRSGTSRRHVVGRHHRNPQSDEDLSRLLGPPEGSRSQRP